MERLPPHITAAILTRAYFSSDYDEFWDQEEWISPFRVTVPLVCRAWRNLARQPAFAELFYRRVRLHSRVLFSNRCFSGRRFVEWFRQRADHIQVRWGGGG